MQRVADEPGFEIDVRPGDGARTMVVVAGEVDLTTAGEMRTTVAEQLAAGPVVLDLRPVRFMDSSGVAALDALRREAAEQGWTLRVCAELPERVKQILDLTGMTKMLDFEPCEES
jgi:anti-anti-sigma factor